MRKRLWVVVLLVVMPCVARADEPALLRYSECDAATRSLIAKVVAGFGGEPALGAIETIRGVADIVQKENGSTFRMSIEAFSNFPDRYFARIRTLQGTMTLAITAQDAYLIPAKASVGGAAIRLTAEERDDLVHYFASDPLFVLRNRKSPRYFFAAGKVESVSGLDCQRLMVFADGLRLDWMVDVATGRVVRTETGGQLNEFSEWTSVGKIPVARTVRTTQDGRLVSEMRYSDYEINPLLDIAPIFRRPDLWLMRWKVQPKPGKVTIAGASEGADSGSAGRAEKSAATYRPPAIETGDADVIIWDPATGSAAQPPQ